MFTFGIGLSALILILCFLPPFHLPRWLATRPPAWIYPILFPAVIVWLQWLRGLRWGVPSWIYEVGVIVGVFLGFFAWYLRAKIAQGKPIDGKGLDRDF